MTLMLGAGPFGQAPAGRLSVDVPRAGLTFLDPYPRRLRGVLAGTVLVDSHRASLLHEHGHLPRAYFPRDDVRMDLLAPGSRVARSATRDGGTYWTARVGGRVAQDAAWSYPDPPLDGLVAFHVGALDEWWEEDERMLGHVRDPYHRCDALPSSRRVRLLIDGVVVADSTRAHVLYETGLPPRWYLPREDVAVRLTPTALETSCAYKGHARWWTAVVGGRRWENVAWTYPDPRRDAGPVAGAVAFFGETVDHEIDGELQPRPRSPWGEPGWWRSVREFERSV